MSEIGNKLEEAINKSGFKVEDQAINFLWKGPKQILPDGTIVQTQKRLGECSIEELQGFLKHCDEMLNNTDNKNPGRYKVKQEIHDQIIKCNAELFIREQINNGASRFVLLDSIRQLLMTNNIKMNELDGYTLADIISTPLGDFSTIPVSTLIDACLDKIGLFSKKHLTTTFILKQGLWLTEEEYAKHEPNLKSLSRKEKEEYFKRLLNINNKHELKINSSGLTLHQLTEALAIRDAKYSQMGSEKLILLRNYLLFVLLKDVDNHIKQWLNITEKILKVLEIKSKK